MTVLYDILFLSIPIKINVSLYVCLIARVFIHSPDYDGTSVNCWAHARTEWRNIVKNGERLSN